MKQRAVEAQRYATLLEWGTWAGLAMLVASFAAYMLGLLSPHVPLDQLPAVWGLPLATYLEQTQTPTGWAWLALAHKGDMANLVGICILAGCSLPPLLGLIPLFLRQGDRVYALICLLVVLVLVLAASGVLTAGH
ncbi:MAG: hypothetical protein K9K38_21645 [Rhodoferax sp.]|jgi:hypothetical protein|nr:hypothetical protein [Rhodoferax sp.]